MGRRCVSRLKAEFGVVMPRAIGGIEWVGRSGKRSVVAGRVELRSTSLSIKLFHNNVKQNLLFN